VSVASAVIPERHRASELIACRVQNPISSLSHLCGVSRDLDLSLAGCGVEPGLDH
jgi:hypothetical protein